MLKLSLLGIGFLLNVSVVHSMNRMNAVTPPGSCSTGLDPSWSLPGTLCNNGTAINLNSLITGDPGGTWSGQGVSGNTLNPSGLSGNIQITYTHASGGCFDSLQQTVFISSVSISADSIVASLDSVCPSGSTTLSVSGGVLGTGADWHWYQTSCGTIPLGTGTSVVVSPSVTTSYLVRAEGTCGQSLCVAKTIVVKTVSSDPTTINASPGSSICLGDALTLTKQGGSLGTNAQWFWYQDGCGMTPVGNGNAVVVSPSMNTAYYVRAEGDCNVSNCAAISIAVNGNGNASWGGLDTVCASAGLTNLNNFITGNSGGTWSGPGVTGNTFNPSGLAGQTITIQYVQGTSPCKDTVANQVFITEEVDASWNNPGSICSTNGIVDLSTLVTGDPGGTWSGPGVTGTQFDPSGLSGSVTLNYAVGSSPCQDVVVHSINILSGPSTPSVVVTDTTICSGETSVISVLNPAVQTGYILYDAASGGNSVGQTNYNASPGTTTTYWIQAEDHNGCVHSGALVPVTITVLQTPSGSVSPEQDICAGSSTSLSASGGTDYLWSTGASASSISVSPSTDTWYYVEIIESSNGCSVTDSVFVNVVTTADVQTAADATSINAGTTVTVDVLDNDTNADPNSLSISGVPVGGLAIVSGIRIQYSSYGNYEGVDTVIYSVCHPTCSSVCREELLLVTITVGSDIIVPGGFSPNGDGYNDQLIFVGLSNYPDSRLEIYNRWGEIVYMASPYNNDWDGSSNGSRTLGDQVTDGTYFYVLTLGNGAGALNGSLEIKRK